jgi:hypothetical protein
MEKESEGWFWFVGIYGHEKLEGVKCRALCNERSRETYRLCTSSLDAYMLP